jgi:hypothetical protein
MARRSVAVTVPCIINILEFLIVNKLFKELAVIVDSPFVSLLFLNKLFSMKNDLTLIH